ncbi:MAG: HAD family hydrolase [Akkermansia sp.]
MTDEEIERQFGPDDLGVIQRLFPGKPELRTKRRERSAITVSCIRTGAPLSRGGRTLHALRSRGIRAWSPATPGKRRFPFNFSIWPSLPILETGSPEGGEADRIRRALDRQTFRREAIYIGDSPTDVDACRALPSAFCRRMGRGGGCKGLERKPDYLLTRFEDLERFFREHHENEGL